MANFYLDNSDLKHHLNHPLMKKLVALRERNYSDAEKYDYAPFNFEDAMDSYEKVLEIAGEISGEIVAANAEDVDHEGPHVSSAAASTVSGRTATNSQCSLSPKKSNRRENSKADRMPTAQPAKTSVR